MLRRPRRPALVVGVLLCATLLAGCGDDGGDSAADGGSGGPGAATASGEPAGSAAPADVSCDYQVDDLLPQAREVDAPPAEPTVGGEVPVVMATSLGDFSITLDAASAPCTVNSFVSLATQGYYDDTPCHRLTTLEEGGIAVLQCGDPTGRGDGGPGYFYADELTGSETYPPGTLAMANRGADTNGSQFFFVYEDTPLPPAYTVFGTFDDAAVEAIRDLAAQGTTTTPDGVTAPTEDVTIESFAWQ